MCGLYGFLSYGKNNVDVERLTEALAIESAVRGTDATGVAYNNGSLRVYKKPLSAYKISFDIPHARALIGHTRHATQGKVQYNYNNHPFKGRAGKMEFALAHNGVLINDEELRQSLNLPKTKVETDSYIAVQLIESRKKLDMESLAYMGELIQGSYSFSVLDKRNNIYLVKGDSPLSILHFPSKKIYIYASTDSILWKALIDTAYFKELQKTQYEIIQIEEGEILKICSNGKLERGIFNYDPCMSYGADWRSYRIEDDSDYMANIRTVAGMFGYSEKDIDSLLDQGYTPDEIEEYFYGG